MKELRAKCLDHIEGLNVRNDELLDQIAANNFKLKELWKEIRRIDCDNVEIEK